MMSYNYINFLNTDTIKPPVMLLWRFLRFYFWSSNVWLSWVYLMWCFTMLPLSFDSGWIKRFFSDSLESISCDFSPRFSWGLILSEWNDSFHCVTGWGWRCSQGLYPANYGFTSQLGMATIIGVEEVPPARQSETVMP